MRDLEDFELLEVEVQVARSAFRCVWTPGDNQATAQRQNNGTSSSSQLDITVGTESRGSWEKNGGLLGGASLF